MYSKRNTITIGLLWLVLMAGGIFWYTRENKQLKLLKTKNEELSKKLDGSLEIIKALETVEREYRLLRERWSIAPKQIVAGDEPSFSLDYLNWIILNNNVALDFDFELKDIRDDGDILKFSFLLSGEGSYHDLYRLIWFLTENPLLYQIENYTLKQGQDGSAFMEFALLIKGFSFKEEWEAGQGFSFDTMKPLVQQIQFYDAFKPLTRVGQSRPGDNLVKKESAPITQKIVNEGLVDIEQAVLQAVARGRAYIKDQSGKLITLKIGDKVRYGSLENINQKKSELEFLLEKQGTTKKVILGLGYKK